MGVRCYYLLLTREVLQACSCVEGAFTDKAKHKSQRFMKTNQSPAPQALARKRRNTYRNLAIEFYARNSSSVLAITHQHWPDQPWTSQPELARILSRQLGWEVDYRTLSRRLRSIHRFDEAVRQRTFQLLAEKELYAPDFSWDAFCGRWNLPTPKKVVPLHQI